MPCRNPGPFLEAALVSVLAQPECLELLVADGGSSDGSLQTLGRIAAGDPRLRVLSEADAGPGDALNRAFRHARGSLIGWLNADDLYAPGSLHRAVAALAAHPHWLMVYGEGQHIDAADALLEPYPTRPPTAGLEGLRDFCSICQPTVVWRRTMTLLLGPFSTELRAAFDYDYWLRAFDSFPKRIGHIPHLQASTRVHPATISATQLPQALLEAAQLQARHFGVAGAHMLERYFQALSAAELSPPPGKTMQGHIATVIDRARPWLSPSSLAALQAAWLPTEPSP